MAAIVRLLCSVLGYNTSVVLILTFLLICLGLFSIFLNGKLLFTCGYQSCNIALINICTGVSVFLFGVALAIDYEDYKSGAPFKDGFSLTFDWDNMSSFTLASFVLHLLSLKTVVLCTVGQAKTSSIYFSKSDSQLLAPLISLCSKISGSGWFLIVVTYTSIEVAYRLVYGGIGAGPEIYGDVKMIQDERNLVDIAMSIILPCFIPAVIGVKLMFLAKAPDFKVKFAHVTTFLSILSCLVCILSFLSDITWSGYRVYYPLKSFIIGLISQSLFGMAFPLIYDYYHASGGYKLVDVHDQ